MIAEMSFEDVLLDPKKVEAIMDKAKLLMAQNFTPVEAAIFLCVIRIMGVQEYKSKTELDQKYFDSRFIYNVGPQPKSKQH